MDAQKISNLDNKLFTLWAGIEAAPARLRSQRETEVEYGEIPQAPLSIAATDARVTKASAKELTRSTGEIASYSFKTSLLCRKINPAPTDVPVNTIKPCLRTKEALDYMASLLEANDAEAVVSQMPFYPVSPFWRTKKSVALIKLPANKAWQMMVWLASKEPQERWARYASQLLLSAEDPEKRDDALFRLTTLRQGGVELTWSFEEVNTPLLTLLIVENRNLINPPHVKIAFPNAALTAALLTVTSLENHLKAYFLGWTASGRPRLDTSKAPPVEVKVWEEVWKRALMEGNLEAARCLVTNNVRMSESILNVWIENPRTNRARWHLLLISAFRAQLFVLSEKHLLNAIERGHSSATFLLASWGATQRQASDKPEYKAGRKLYKAVEKFSPPSLSRLTDHSFLTETLDRVGYGNTSVYSSYVTQWPLSREMLSLLLSSPKTPFLTPNAEGWTALHEIARLSITRGILHLFLDWAESQRGVSFAPKDNRGRTPYEVAVEEGNLSTARELRALQLLPIAPKRSDRP